MLFILTLFFITTLLAAIIYRRKHFHWKIEKEGIVRVIVSSVSTYQLLLVFGLKKASLLL